MQAFLSSPATPFLSIGNTFLVVIATALVSKTLLSEYTSALRDHSAACVRDLQTLRTLPSFRACLFPRGASCDTSCTFSASPYASPRTLCLLFRILWHSRTVHCIVSLVPFASPCTVSWPSLSQGIQVMDGNLGSPWPTTSTHS